MEFEKNQFENEVFSTDLTPSQIYSPVIELNSIPGKNASENRILANYGWAINQVGDEIKYFARKAIENGRTPPIKKITFNLRVGDLDYKLRGFKVDEKGRVTPDYEKIDMEEIKQVSPNEYNVTISNQFEWFPPVSYEGCAIHALGGHLAYGVNGNEKQIERAVLRVLDRSGKKDIVNYMRRNSGYIV